jgi:hypothetical protein
MIELINLPLFLGIIADLLTNEFLELIKDGGGCCGGC